MTRDEMIDLLRSLSIIEGVSFTCDKTQREAIQDQLIWATDKLLELIKEKR